VYQNRDFDLATGVDSQVHVNFRRADPTKAVMFSGHPLDWSSEIEIVMLARKVANQEAGDVVDAIWVQVFGLVMADQTLGGLADYLEPGTAEVENAEADTSTARLNWSITVQHRTANNVIA
jgi:hypothetical protein